MSSGVVGVKMFGNTAIEDSWGVKKQQQSSDLWGSAKALFQVQGI